MFPCTKSENILNISSTLNPVEITLCTCMFAYAYFCSVLLYFSLHIIWLWVQCVPQTALYIGINIKLPQILNQFPPVAMTLQDYNLLSGLRLPEKIWKNWFVICCVFSALSIWREVIQLMKQSAGRRDSRELLWYWNLTLQVFNLVLTLFNKTETFYSK